MAFSDRAEKRVTLETMTPEFCGICDTSAQNEDASSLPTGTETVLFVDDEAVIRHIGKRLLERFGYRVLLEKNGSDALLAFQDKGESIDLVILDKTMPGMDGIETLQEIKQIKPGVRALLTSGYASCNLEELKEQGFCGFISKPFNASQMIKMIRASLDGAVAP